MREKISNYVSTVPTRIRTNLWFVILVGFIMIAAGLSLSYAFLRQDSPSPVAESSLQVATNTRAPERMPEVATLDDSTGSNAEVSSPSQEGATLGDSVNCTLENEKFGMPVQLQQKELKQATLLTAEALYREFERLYDEYRTNIESKGCAPNLKLPYTLGELMQSLR